jgi:hypothetical protein
MSYLLQSDYSEMIYNSINLESNLIADYFISEYEKNKDKNIDFINQLSNSIYLFESVINKHKEFIKTTDISSDEFNYFNHVFSDYSFTDKEKTLKYSDLINLIEGLKLFIDITEDNSTENEEFVINKKIKWNGGPSDFGFLINELIANGWIDKPYNNHSKNANFFYDLFDIDTTIGTLASELNENRNSLSPDSKNMFRISLIDKMRKQSESNEKVKEIK